MKYKILTTLLLISAASSLFAGEDGERLFDAKCGMCHLKTRPTDMKNLVAPPLMGVMRHVKMTYPNKTEALAFMREYVMHPTREKAVCMPQKIQRFGLMPSQKENVTEEELAKITEWMYENFPPAGFRGHGRGMMRVGM